jgi:protein SCO1/2
MRGAILSLLVAAVGGALVWAAFFWQPQPAAPPHAAQPLAAAPRGGDFVLRSAGGPVALKDLRGKVVLLYFGYTFCPDICPTSLAVVAQALSGLNPEELDRVGAIFVSVDPERDTTDKLKDYAAYFHPKILGVTGTPGELAALARGYGASYRKQEVGSRGGYVVDHSSFTYLIDPAGRLAASLPHGTPAPRIVEEIRRLLNKPSGEQAPSRG